MGIAENVAGVAELVRVALAGVGYNPSDGRTTHRFLRMAVRP